MSFIAGKKLELKQLAEIDGGLFRLVFGGQSGGKGTLDVLKTEAILCRRSNSIVFFFFVFGANRSFTTVLEANPWRETPKPVYVLTQRENQLCTMKTRKNQSEVERELGMLFSKGGKWKNRAKQPEADTRFQMLVEDIREGVLVFEDENEAARYCDLLQGGGQGCEGVAEIEASSVFDLCRKMRALAVLFRRGRTPPLPESLKLNLRARKRSLEDQENLM
uniref:Uncharacterized protein n=1 Tax=Nicotiana tabacum TaxID=4097 RepID=A0A1S4AQE8_TOBAC|nr:PREDICTED: uncharacterized protein LOC107800327 [Nicotiana tabacum]